MANINWTDIVLAVVALYGAGLSTYTFIMERRDKRPSLNLRLSYGVLQYASGGKLGVIFDVSNTGRQLMTVTSIGLRLPSGHTIYEPSLPGTASLPVELQPGQGQKFWMRPYDVAQTLHQHGYAGVQKVRAVCTDAAGREYFSKPGSFNVEARLADSSPANTTD